MNQTCGIVTMKLLLLLLLALPSAGLQDVGENSQHRNDSLVKTNPKDKGAPEIKANTSTNSVDVLAFNQCLPSPRRKRQTEPSSAMLDTNSKLKWQPWSGTVPKDVVSIYNTYADRRDYICKYKCHAGFHNPDLGSYCHYSHRGEGNKDPLFEILVNEDNFEMLEWKAGSGGRVPHHSVKTCSNDEVYVGKNEYGLGKVRPSYNGFHLPWKATEYTYNDYQVLTIRHDVKKEHLSNIKYDSKASIIQYPPESMHISTIVNCECSSVTKPINFNEEYQVERRWDIDSSAMFSEKRSISAVVPAMKVATGEDPTTLPKNLTVEVRLESSFMHSGSVNITEDFSQCTSINVTIPPKHECRIYQMVNKYKVNLPFTAHLKRTYSDGENTRTNVNGIYENVWTDEVQVVVDRCKPVTKGEPCVENPVAHHKNIP